jgi:hypothetical protein
MNVPCEGDSESQDPLEENLTVLQNRMFPCYEIIGRLARHDLGAVIKRVARTQS